jgi:hypothetical protein
MRHELTTAGVVVVELQAPAWPGAPGAHLPPLLMAKLIAAVSSWIPSPTAPKAVTFLKTWYVLAPLPVLNGAKPWCLISSYQYAHVDVGETELVEDELVEDWLVDDDDDEDVMLEEEVVLLDEDDDEELVLEEDDLVLEEEVVLLDEDEDEELVPEVDDAVLEVEETELEVLEEVEELWLVDDAVLEVEETELVVVEEVEELWLVDEIELEVWLEEALVHKSASDRSCRGHTGGKCILVDALDWLVEEACSKSVYAKAIVQQSRRT